MRYLAIAVLSALGGFIAAWWVWSPPQGNAPGPERTEVVTGARPSSLPALPAAAPAAESANPLRFEDIDAGATVFDQLFTAWRLAAGADIPQLEQWIARANRSTDPLYTLNVVPLLLERYTALDPGAAMNYVISQPEFDQVALQGHVLTSWIRNEPDGAIAWFRQIANRQIKLSIGYRLLNDPTLAQSGILDEIEAEIGPEAEQMKAAIERSRADPAELFEQLLASTDPNRGRSLQQTLQRWMQQDPEVALARVNAIPSQTTRTALLRMALMQYAAQDPRAALAYLQANTPLDTDIEMIVLQQFARADLKLALPYVEELARRTGSSKPYEAIMSAWASQDPDGAIQSIESRDPPVRERLYSSFATNYGIARPADALDWAAGLEGDEFAMIRIQTFNAVSVRNAALLETTLDRTTDETIRAELINVVAQQRARSDPRGTIAWLDAYQNDPVYPVAYKRVLQTVAQEDPAMAAGMLGDLPRGLDASGEVRSISGTWFRHDADAALRWARSLQNADLRANALGAIVSNIAYEDPDRALDLASELPSGARRDQALLSVARTMVQKAPERLDEIVAELGISAASAEELKLIAEHALRQRGR